MLLMIVSATLNRTYLSALSGSIDKQVEVEAMNYAQSMAEVLFGTGTDYENLDTNLGNFDDVTDPDRRFGHVTTFGDSLFATIDIGPEQTLIHGVQGRRATITVFEKKEGTYNQLVEQKATINPR